MGRLSNEIQKADQPKQLTVNDLAKRPDFVSRFAAVLGGQDKANQFLANVIAAVNANKSLQECNPVKVMSCAMTAAALNLDVVPGLGFAAIVPYAQNVPRRDKNGNILKDSNGRWITDRVQIPQFQIMKNGFVQLAMRSGQVQTINVTDVYSDELEKFDRLTGELKLKDVPGGARDSGRDQNIIGYACYVKLVNGFEKTVFWSIQQMRQHAEAYSQAYRNDLKEHKQNSPWSTNFPAMAEKTVIKSTISKWVPMSTQMLLAQKADQSSIHEVRSADGNLEVQYEYVDSENNIPEDSEVMTLNSEATEKEILAESKTEAVPQETQPAGPEDFDDSPFDDSQAYGESLYGNDDEGEQF